MIKPYDFNTILKKYVELQSVYTQCSIDDLHSYPITINMANGTAVPAPPGGGNASGQGGGNSGGGSGGNNPPLPPPNSTLSNQGLKFLNSRHEEGEYIIQRASALDAQMYLRRGCPPSLRARMWRIACGFSDKITMNEEQYYLKLRYDCDRYDLVTDELFMYDIQTVLDDPRFFVFEEELKEVVLCFSRDTTVPDQLLYQIHALFLKQMGNPLDASTPSSGNIPGNTSTTSNLPAPPSSIQPFLGFTTYFAPLCYVFRHKVALYNIAKYLFNNVWCKLNVISSNEDCILHVCKTFEHLLYSAHPKLFLHLVSINVQPIKIAFPWIQLGFVGLLEIDQILNLWERVIGYMDPMIFAIAAVAIFLHRSEMLLRCTVDTEAAMILMEGSRLHIMTLIQAYLMRDGRNVL